VVFTIGIDPHKGSHVAVVLNEHETLLEELRVRADRHLGRLWAVGRLCGHRLTRTGGELRLIDRRRGQGGWSRELRVVEVEHLEHRVGIRVAIRQRR